MRQTSTSRTTIEDLAGAPAPRLGHSRYAPLEDDERFGAHAELVSTITMMSSAGTTTSPGQSDEDN